MNELLQEIKSKFKKGWSINYNPHRYGNSKLSIQEYLPSYPEMPEYYDKCIVLDELWTFEYGTLNDSYIEHFHYDLTSLLINVLEDYKINPSYCKERDAKSS